MFFRLDCRQGAPSIFRPESRQGNHRSKGHMLCFVATSQTPAVLASIGQALNKFEHWPWWHGPSGFKMVEKHGLHGISLKLLKIPWRRLKVRQRAQTPSICETSNLAGESFNKRRAEIKRIPHHLEWMIGSTPPFFNFFKSQRGCYDLFLSQEKKTNWRA